MSFLPEIFVFFLTTNLLSETKWQWSCVDHLVQTQLNNGLNNISLSLNSLEMCQHRPCRMSFSSSTHGFISGVKDGSSSSCYHGTEETQGSTHSKGMIRCYTWFLFTPHGAEYRCIILPHCRRDWENQPSYLAAMCLGFPGPIGLVSKGTMT